jgi:hypothetical protein
VTSMAKRSFSSRSESFGFDTADPWALDALRLVFHVPRAYTPLVEAWDERHPGTIRALGRLVDKGFVAHQPGLIVDTRNGKIAERESRRLTRWRATARGRRAYGEFIEDVRVFEDTFSHTKPVHIDQTLALLGAFQLEDSHARYGISAAHAIEMANMPERLGRWWVQRFADAGYLVQLDQKLADVREVIPGHWRVTRVLCRQLHDVLSEFGPAHLINELRLNRMRFLDDIDPARVGLTGATDYDHDVEAQKVVAAVLRSPRWAGGGVFVIEPRIVLPIDHSTRPWSFGASGDHVVFYQPDAELRGYDELGDGGKVRRYIVEYERFQSRRDAWGHIERLLGYLHTRTHPAESAALLFVVDTESRRRTYVELVEAFADHLLENPRWAVANPTTLAVSTVKRITDSSDPLDLQGWSRIQLPSGADTGGRPVLHPPEDSPYDAYFGRS